MEIDVEMASPSDSEDEEGEDSDAEPPFKFVRVDNEVNNPQFSDRKSIN